MAMTDSGPSVPQGSRCARVRAILDQAAQGAAASYEGHDRFWNLPLPQLLELELYGVRMIAPAGEGGVASGDADRGAGNASTHGTCCHTAPTPAPAAPRPGESGRGAASGLIKGLKGQFPFDGSQFPPLPWGGTRVADADVRFIEQWIDDGCPAEDTTPSTTEMTSAHTLALAQGREVHRLHTGSLNAFRGDAGSLKVRKNVEFLSPDELARLCAALAKMKALDSHYQDERSFAWWARIHANSCQHGWEEFLTWHRVYLYLFELQLQDIDPTVTLPYWDWPHYAEDVQKSIEDMRSATGLDNGVVPGAYRCWIDEAGLQRLAAGGQVPKDVLDKLAALIGRSFNSGNRLFVAAGIAYGQDKHSDTAIMQELAAINPLWHRQRWPGGDKDLIFEAYPAPSDIDQLLQLGNFFAFGSGPGSDHFFGALENIHNLIHNFSGGMNPNYVKGTPPANRDEPQTGDMVNAGVTAFDPIFWAHHSNVDRLWAEWQKLHPNVGPDNPSAILPPWKMTVQQTYNVANLGYEYMKSSHLFLTDGGQPIQHFRSALAQVHPAVMGGHRRGEVRLHRVRHVMRPGFHIRVFLNQPDADVHTPTRGNDHYVGTLHMFTGLCIGGPGHCDEPSQERHRFDQRPRPHKLPANFRLEATHTVRKLRAKGAVDLHVDMVVLNTDGTPAHDALLLDAVSLNFLD